MLSVKDAQLAILKEYDDSIVSLVMDPKKDFYIVAIEPKNLKKGDISLDSYFKVNKNTGKIDEYSCVMDPKEFGVALNNIVYKKG